MKASDYIVDFLIQKSVKYVFGYMGGMITHIADSINKSKQIEFITVYHEQTAAFAAVGYAKYSGTIGVALATSGPGATNLITGIADAYFDSIPALFITGQVNTYEYKYDKPVRQVGFQELEVINAVRPFTKYVKLVDDLNSLPDILEYAYNIATEGRKGPVLLDIPMNIQRGILNNIDLPLVRKSTVSNRCKVDLPLILELLSDSKRPLILVGGGVSSDCAVNLLQEFLAKTQIPFVASLNGKNACNEYVDSYVGCIGSYGNRCANMAMANTDLLLVFGSRLDVRQIGSIVDSVAISGKIIQFDIDENEMRYSKLTKKINMYSSVEVILEMLLSKDIECNFEEWKEYIEKIKCKYNQNMEISRNIVDSSPYDVMKMLNKISNPELIYCSDVGQHQMWAMQTLNLRITQRFYTSGGLGSMGCCLPMAVGIAFASGGLRDIYAICGDGGFHMSVQSLLVISQHKLPIKIIVINNKSLGMITQFQELYFGNVTIGTNERGGYLVPNIEHMAKSYNLEYLKYDMTMKKRNLDSLMGELLKLHNCIVEIVVSEDCRVYPKLEFNQPIFNPSPCLSNDELVVDMVVNYKNDHKQEVLVDLSTDHE